MDKLKKVFSPGHDKDDEVMYNTPQESTVGATGKVTGQGSHFSNAKSTADTTMAEDSPGSGAPIPSTNQPASQDTSRAAVGQTSTYSSTQLTKGDATSSVVDPNSSDPTTFKKPEAAPAGGVNSGGALTAASLAFQKKSGDNGMPGSYPGDGASNPYATSRLDPRVDAGGPDRTVHDRVTFGQEGEGSHLAATTAGAGAAGAVGAGAYEATKSADTAPTTATQPAASTTEDPANRSTEYSQAAGDRGLDRASAAATGPVPGDLERDEEEGEKKKGVRAKIVAGLGAVGIGVGLEAARQRGQLAEEKTEEGAVEDTTTAAPPPSGPPTHHRKESIPTTAYPSGSLDSPKAQSQPVGGTQSSQDTQPAPSTSEYAAPAVAAAGATGLGAAAFEEEHHRSAAQPSEASAADTKPIVSGTDARAEPQEQRGVVSAEPEPRDEKHLGRDAAVAGAAGAGAGALAEHEYSNREAEKADQQRQQAEAAAAKERERQQKEAQKQAEKEEKAQEKEEKKAAKEAEKEKKAEEKAAAKEEKAREKGEKKAEKEAAKEEKAREKEEKKAEKEAEKERKSREKEEKKAEAEAEKEEKRRRKEEEEAAAVAAGTAAGTGVAAEEMERDKKTDAHDTAIPQRTEAVPAAGTGVAAEEMARDKKTDTVDTAIPQRTEAVPAAGTGVAAEEMARDKKTDTVGTGIPQRTEAEAPQDSAAPRYEAAKEVDEIPQGHHFESATEGRRPSQTMFGLAAADAADKEKYDYKNKNKHGKPGFFRRIFKRRKNVDTGESEEYSSEEEHPGPHPPSGYPAEVEGQSSGVGRPSYNPFKKTPNVGSADSAGHS